MQTNIKKLAALGLASVAIGLSGCSQAPTTTTQEPEQQPEKSILELELENTHNFWKEMGSDCDGSCIPEGIRYFDTMPKGLHGNPTIRASTINRSEIRHAGTMGVSAPSREFTAE